MPAYATISSNVVLAISLLAGSPTAQSPTIPASELRALEGAAKKLAKAGFRSQTHTTLDVLSTLGYPKRKLNTLQTACEKDLRRPKHSKTNLAALTKQVRDASRKLSAHLTSTSGADRSALATQILKLDYDNNPAHEALGHTKTNGIWKEAWIAEVEARRIEVNNALDRARHLSIPIIETDSSSTILNQALGRVAAQARYADITVHSTMSPGVTACILTESMRASAFASWVLGDKLAPSRTRPFAVLLINRSDIYKKVIESLKASGALSVADAKQYAAQNHFWDAKNEQFVKFTTIPEEAQSYITFESLRDRPGFFPQPWLIAGLFNWVSLSYHGWRIPLYNAVTITAKDASANASLQIYKAGVRGAHSHLATLAARGKAPTLEATFQHEVGAIHGDALLFASSMVEFLTYQFNLQKICNACPGKDAIDTKKRTVQIEAATGLSKTELNDRWTRWITDKSTSVAGSLSAEISAGTDREAKTLISQINALRAKVLSRVGSAPKVSLDSDLSRGCAQHAVLIDNNPKATGDTEGSTDIGSWAAYHSLSTSPAPKVRELLSQWMGSLQSRAALLEPGLTRVGFARSKNAVVLDCHSMIQPVREEVMLGWPYDGMTRVPTTPGYPISLQVRRTTESPKGAITMKLFEGKPARKRQVECKFLSPDPAQMTGRISPNLYALIPSSLLPGKQYYVVVEFSESKKKKVWSFKT